MSKTLAIHPGALGDVILFGRVLQELDGEVTLIAGRSKGTLLQGLGAVDRIMDFDSLPMHEAFTDTPLQDCRLPKILGQCDRLISCYALGDRRAELRLAGLCGSSSAAFVPIRPSAEFTGHLTELWCDMLGIDRSVDELASQAWAVPEKWQRDGLDALSLAGVRKPYVAIQAGAGAAEKCWPIENFYQLAEYIEKLGNSHQAAPVFILGPVELEMWGDEVRQKLTSKFNVIQNPSLETLAGILAGADCFIGNDSGCSHLAAGVGTRTIALFGPTKSDHFKPLGPRTSVIQARTMENIDITRVIRESPY